jgi:hypothetical protein
VLAHEACCSRLGRCAFDALAGRLLAVPVGDYLTKLAHVPETEGQRGMTVFFLCVSLGIMASLVIGVIASVAVVRLDFRHIACRPVSNP